jgi:sugar phosphate isomerase/epimerase
MENGSSLKKFISSTVFYHNFEKAVELAQSLGCGIEISRFGKLREIEENFDRLKGEYKAILKDFEGDVALHGFFSNLSIASKDPLIKEISEKRYWQSFELAAELGAKTVIFHTCYNNLLKHKDYQENFFLRNIEFYKGFVEEFEHEGIVATIENVHEKDTTFIRNLVGAINSPNLKVTLDVGHVNLHSIIAPCDWIKDYGIMLYHMHLHNNFCEEDSHGSLKCGSVDFIPIIRTLKEMHLRPSITFEIFNKDALLESIEYFDEIWENV